MFNITKLNAQGRDGKTGAAVIEYLMATEYYLGKDGQAQDTMAWGGKMAQHLNLAAQAVTREHMQKLAEGFDPITGRALCQNAGQKGRMKPTTDKNGDPVLDEQGKPVMTMVGGHRVGFDVTASAPLDVSIAFALASVDEKEAILRAHREASGKAMDRLESMVETRRGKRGRGDVMGVKALVWSSHQHFANRDLEPNLHTHHLVYGVCVGVDGEEATFDALELFRNARAVDEIYKLELYRNLQGLGYKLDHIREINDDGQETGRVYARLAGMTEEVMDQFGSRRKALLAYAEEHGVSKKQAALATRKHKDEPAYQELVDHWQEVLQGFGVTTQALKQAQGNVAKAQHKSDAELMERLHDKHAIFNDIDLTRVLGEEYAGVLDANGLEARIAQFKADNDLILVNAERLAKEDQGKSLARKHTEERFCAAWMLDAEQEIVDIANRRSTETRHHVPQEALDRVVEDYEQSRGFTLSREQRGALEHITQQGGGVVNLSGLAGTGKTTIAECFKAAFETQGKRLLGVCVSNQAAKKLESESGMPCQSMAQLLSDLSRGRMAFQSDDVIVIDEAGMVDTRSTRDLLKVAEAAGAVVILQGDAEQLQPIGAGSGFQLTKRAVGDVKLTEIRRQARAEDRATALAFYETDEHGRVVDLKKGTRSRDKTLKKGEELKAHLSDAIVESATQKDSIERLVADYFKALAKLDDKLVLGHSRAEVAALNAKIRQGLKDRGEIGSEEIVLEGRDKGRKTEVALVKGDRIMFTSKSKDLGVVNGTQATVQSFKASRKGGYDVTATLRSEDPKENGRRVTWNSHDYKTVSLDYAITVHKSQGQGKREIFHLMNVGMMDNAASLVAFTRLTKGQYRLYGSYDDVGELHTRLGLERLKATVLDAGVKERPAAIPPAQRPKAPAGVLQSKLGALFHEHKEGHGTRRAMTESERKAHRLLEVLDLAGRRATSRALPADYLHASIRSQQGIVR
ncbi:MobF family relaxase [Stenotrophomonas maltophilia]|uniref:MobF family relaxase n=1 Tax=Stenotrophomonas maltophilia TaxID=40324 RepID=UPI00209B2A2B|nr:MobF family relaxase [Stenotrophomonas maltophilia]MCO7473067.1 relaxase domain-containing protein [Stenotrophomonas maltophilia]